MMQGTYIFKEFLIEREKDFTQTEHTKGELGKEEQKKFQGDVLNIRPELGNPVYLDDIDKQMRLGNSIPTLQQTKPQAAAYLNNDEQEERKGGFGVDDTV